MLTYVPNMNHICHNNFPHWQSMTKPQLTNEYMREVINHLTHTHLLNYNKIYPNTNSWKTLQEESLWQEDFDDLYFWNTLNKTHQGILVWNRNIRFHTICKKHVHKERKEATHVKIGERTIITTSNVYICIYINKYKVCYHNMITRSKVHEQCI